MQISNINAAVASQLPAMLPARGSLRSVVAANESSQSTSPAETRNVQELRETFTQFAGETFFGK